jgi:hypothetical protein
MKKTYQIKRTLVQTKKGLKPYYFQDGKRVKDAVGRRKFIQQNYDALNKPYSKAPKNLTANEIRSLNQRKAQKELYRYKGKPVDKAKAEFLKSMNIIRQDDKERDILKLTRADGKPLFDSYGRFENVFEQLKGEVFTTSFETMMGAEGWRGRTQMESAISIVEGINLIGYKGWKIEATLPDGRVVRGKEKFMEEVKDFEVETTALLTELEENVAAVSFVYTFDWDFTNKILSINLWDSKLRDAAGELIYPKGGMVDAQIRQSDPIKRTK